MWVWTRINDKGEPDWKDKCPLIDTSSTSWWFCTAFLRQPWQEDKACEHLSKLSHKKSLWHTKEGRAVCWQGVDKELTMSGFSPPCHRLWQEPGGRAERAQQECRYKIKPWSNTTIILTACSKRLAEPDGWDGSLSAETHWDDCWMAGLEATLWDNQSATSPKVLI